MPPASATILERLITAYQRGERLVLVFDYDGTPMQDSGLRPNLHR